MTDPNSISSLLPGAGCGPLAYHTRSDRMTTTTSLADLARRDLSGLSDRIVGPDDPTYDEARAVHNGMIDRRPAVLVTCSSADDVARCVAFGKAHDVPIAV